MVQTEKRLAELGIELPPPPKPAANYAPCVRLEGFGADKNSAMLHLSGHLPLRDDGSVMTGRIGKGPNDKGVDYGYQAARQVGLNILATLQRELDGDLDKVEKVVKLFGIVRSSDDFTEQHLCLNGCSDLMVEVLGKDRGVHARSAVGANSLPLGTCVEVEAVVKVRLN